MAALAPYALPGIIVVTALGAFITCLLVIRYGFRSDGDEEADEIDRRRYITRLGQAVAAVCFAAAALLAVLVMGAPWSEPRRVTVVAEAPAPAADQIANLVDEVRRLEERVTRDLAALDERLGLVEGAVARTSRPARGGEEAAKPLPARPQRPEPVVERPAPAVSRAPAPRVEAPRAPVVAPSPPVALSTEGYASAVASRLRATVQGVRVDFESRPGREAAVYTVRLFDSVDRPLYDADVSLLGQAADGSAVSAPLPATSEPGVYRGLMALTPGGPKELRLRVVGGGRRFELALAQAVSWEP